MWTCAYHHTCVEARWQVMGDSSLFMMWIPKTELTSWGSAGSNLSPLTHRISPKLHPYKVIQTARLYRKQINNYQRLWWTEQFAAKCTRWLWEWWWYPSSPRSWVVIKAAHHAPTVVCSICKVLRHSKIWAIFVCVCVYKYICTSFCLSVLILFL